MPMGNSGTEYSPVAPVWSVRVSPVSGLETVTSAPMITAPCGSVTVPWIVPRKVWADKNALQERMKASKNRNFMTSSFEKNFCSGVAARNYNAERKLILLRGWQCAHQRTD